ncbi:GNAT family N-acetyltransferase, partial [bacterium]
MRVSLEVSYPKDRKQERQALALLCDCFPRLKRSYFLNRIFLDPRYEKRNSLILIKGGSIISYLHMFKRDIWHKGKRMKFVGLGEICTSGQCRGRGYASLLIREAVRRCESSIISLFTKTPGYYRRFGFSLIKRKKVLIKKQAWLPVSLPGMRLRRFSYRLDIAQAAKLHRSFFSGLSGFALRNKLDWLSQLKYFNEEKSLFLVLIAQGKMLAYIRCKRLRQAPERSVEIVEYACANSGIDCLPYFISHLFSSCGFEEVIFSKVYSGGGKSGLRGNERI